MATIKEMLTANTADILEATELLKVLGDREGQFVWKQLTAEDGDFVAFVTADDENSYPNGGMQDGYWYELVDTNGGQGGYVWKKYITVPPTYASNLTMTVVVSSGNSNIQITSANFDLTHIPNDWKSFFQGFTAIAGTRYFDSNGRLWLNYNYTKLDFTTFTATSATTGILGTEMSNTNTTTDTYTFSGEKCIREEHLEFVDYVVSKDAEAFPNGGELDGYWYELVKEVGSVAQAFGLTKIAIDEKVWASNVIKTNLYNSNNGLSIPHSLGEQPEIVILASDSYDGKNGVAMTMSMYYSSTGMGGYISIGKTYTTYYSGSNRSLSYSDQGDYGYISAATDKNITLRTTGTGATICLPAGRKYYLITMA